MMGIIIIYILKEFNPQKVESIGYAFGLRL